MSEALVIEHAAVVTENDLDEVLFDATVVIEGNRITQVRSGETLPAPRPDGARVIDASGKALLPGFVDLHYHTAVGKGWNDQLPLSEYLQTCWYPMIRALDPDAAYWAALASYTESIKCGVTTVNDMYRQLGSLAAAAEEIGIRAVLSNDVATAEHRLDTLEDNQRAFEMHNGAANGRIEVYVGIEWLPLASRELLRDARTLADELGTGIHIHLNESLGEVEISKERFGQRPTEVAYDTGILGRNCIAAHCVWLSDTEIALMRETRTQVAHNPTSNAKLGNGVARVPEMLAAGLNVGLGHDAAECNNSPDMFEVMKFSSLIHRAMRVDPRLQQAPDVLRMATRNGAEALGHHSGVVAVGRKADVVLINLQNEMFTPLLPRNREQLLSHLVFAANGGAVDSTIIDGRVVMEDRRLNRVDEEKVRMEATRALQRVLGRMEAPVTL